ncbi:MAG: hypothetical protein J5830_04055 [Clostridia bacterium]|nr:hypothetical protein [Clostridia bacterium]
MKEHKKSRRSAALPFVITSAILFVLLACLAVLFFFTYSELENARKLYDPSAARDNAVQKSESELASENVRLGRQLLIAEQTREELENRISELEKELELQRGEADADEDTLNGMIASLRKELDQKKSEIESLKQDIRLNSRVNSLDLNAVEDALSAISVRVNDIPDDLVIKTPVLRLSEGVPVVDEKGEAIYDIVESTPRIALFYSDLTRGYSCSFGSGDGFSSTEMDMLLLAYQLVTSKIAEDNRIALASSTGAENAESAREYDFDEVIPCSPSTEGVGENGDGTYSVSELITIMLENGDEGAYNALVERYGSAKVLSAATSVGLDVTGGKISFTASRAGGFAGRVYDLTEGESETAQDVKNALSNSINSALTAYSVSPKEVAHICMRGECYGDVAFVYDDNPYVVVILSDMSPGDAVNSYLGSVIELVDKLHESLGK